MAVTSRKSDALPFHERPEVAADGGAGQRSLLVVTTVTATMGFLYPYVDHFRARGWRVDGAARGIANDQKAAGAFDAVHELSLSRSIRNVAAMAVGIRAVSAVLERGYDIVHVHTPVAAFVTRVAARRLPSGLRPSVAYTAHGFHFHEGGHPLSNAIFLTAERVAGRWTDRLVVINEEDFRAARRHHIVPVKRLRHMNGIGIDTDWYSTGNVTPDASRRALQEVGLEPDRPFFVMVGELNRNKRPTDVLRALAQMRDGEPALLFLGDGPQRAELKTMADELNVEDRVVLSDSWIEDIRPLVAPAIALVSASKREGLPRGIMEALSLEVPVVTSAARGSRELVGSDRGCVVRVGAIAEMAAAMDRLARSPEDRVAMGRRGRRLMVERYDLKPLITEHERLYAELLDERTMQRGWSSDA